jgi:hypothetical protein
MTTSLPKTTKPATITTTLTVVVTKEAKPDMNADDFRRELETAADLRKAVESAIPERGGVIEGSIMIGKQKFKL